MYESENLKILSDLIRNNKINPEKKGKLKCGVDLGTANIVLVVVDENNTPVTGAIYPSKVVKDGIVVDYVGAIRVVKVLKGLLEERLGSELTNAACAIPPGIIPGNAKAIGNVVESSGFILTDIVDEPTAASSVLNIKDGAVVDIGGGTTGISILKDGKVIFTADEPTGGTHMTLTIAGYYNVSYEEAEKLKQDPTKQKDIYPIIRPVVEKMASIVKNFLEDYDTKDIYIVGGATLFDDFEQTFSKVINRNVIKVEEALLVTPLGIAIHCL